MNKLRDQWHQFRDLIGILWYHGTFPLSFVTVAAGLSFAIGLMLGLFL